MASLDVAARVALAGGDAAGARRDMRQAATLCLENDDVVAGAALALTAIRVLADHPSSWRWLLALRVLPRVQEPVRRAAIATAVPTPGAGSAPPATLQALLSEIVAAALPSD